MARQTQIQRNTNRSTERAREAAYAALDAQTERTLADARKAVTRAQSTLAEADEFLAGLDL